MPAPPCAMSVRTLPSWASIQPRSSSTAHLLAGISRRLHGLVHDVQTYTLHSGMQRVISYLLHELPEESNDAAGIALACAGHGQPQGPGGLDVTLPVSKATMASRLSLTPEYFSRVLHELEAAGLIAIDKRDILIPDPGRLARHNLQ